MKLTNEICISFLRGSGWLYNHDKEITISERNKAIDDAKRVILQTLDNEILIDTLHLRLEQLKEGAGIGTDNQ